MNQEVQEDFLLVPLDLRSLVTHLFHETTIVFKLSCLAGILNWSIVVYCRIS